MIIKRIISRPDFDGVVCAVLLKEALGESIPIVWTQPNKIQNGDSQVAPGDVVANLPLSGNVSLWFDHHVSNTTEFAYEGLYRIAPSAAGLIFEYYKDQMDDRFQVLVQQADKIDSAQLSLDEIQHPERFPYVLLSMTIVGRQPSDSEYCDRLVPLLKNKSIDQVLADPLVHERCEKAVAANRAYKIELIKHTNMLDQVSISDFRGMSPVPDGNRFLVYSLFPQAIVNMKLYDEGPYVVVKLGHSIIKQECRVNVGNLLKTYGGGGHRGAGACRLPKDQAQSQINDIIDVLVRNESSPDEAVL